MQVLKVPSLFSSETCPRRAGGRSARVALTVAAVLLGTWAFALTGAGSARAQAADTKPYDEQLLRLAEILGAVHYLRELCSANDGQLWRDRMKELLDTEGATALRRARLTRSFNQGYRSYRRTYATCTPTAQSSIERFLAEGIEIGDGLVKNVR
ncbi:MAG TPA: TIGR02301 family protein [Hyphomicrobium sp.]|uniref:TIGR02301 family protein n=1 Tax=Hyphomicrobium sp. TaxID=82 RepID=UPI002B6E71AE|nr:TIGR02301 family protein [Hyphomicrobium sp.]HRN87027.1 TIGR02301 family protein [Hyphomicrobium sp.]